MPSLHVFILGLCLCRYDFFKKFLLNVHFFLAGNAEWKQCINRNRFSGFQSLEVFSFLGPFAMYCGQSG